MWRQETACDIFQQGETPSHSKKKSNNKLLQAGGGLCPSGFAGADAARSRI
jgi:hypothetical protein